LSLTRKGRQGSPKVEPRKRTLLPTAWQGLRSRPSAIARAARPCRLSQAGGAAEVDGKSHGDEPGAKATPFPCETCARNPGRSPQKARTPTLSRPTRLAFEPAAGVRRPPEQLEAQRPGRRSVAPPTHALMSMLGGLSVAQAELLYARGRAQSALVLPIRICREQTGRKNPSP